MDRDRIQYILNAYMRYMDGARDDLRFFIVNVSDLLLTRIYTLRMQYDVHPILGDLVRVLSDFGRVD